MTAIWAWIDIFKFFNIFSIIQFSTILGSPNTVLVPMIRIASDFSHCTDDIYGAHTAPS